MKCKKLFPWPENLTTMQMQHPIVSEFLKWPGRRLSHPVTRSGGFTSWTKGNLISTSWRRVSGLTRGEMGQAQTLIVYEGKLKSVHFLNSGNDVKYYLDLFKYFQIYSFVHSQPVLSFAVIWLTIQWQTMKKTYLTSFRHQCSNELWVVTSKQFRKSRPILPK